MIPPSPSALAADFVLPFQIEPGTLRGRLVRLGPALDEILSKHNYPRPVAKLLAETAATGAALAALLKYDGKFSLQARGDGAVSLLVADMTHAGDLRAYAQFDAARVAAMGDEGIGLMGKGYLAFTVEPPAGSSQERYQGIVELRGKDIAAAAQYYFRSSEQIPTGLVAAARHADDGTWHAGCLVVQHIPEEDGASLLHGDNAVADAWQRAMILLSTASPLELTDPALPPESLLFRLFHEDGVRAFTPRPLQHQCGCVARIGNTLRLFSRNEVKDMAQDGIVTMTCQFCGATYRYAETEIDALFAATAPAAS